MRALFATILVLAAAGCATTTQPAARGGGPTSFGTAAASNPNPRGPQPATQLTPLGSGGNNSNLVRTQGDWATNPFGY